MTLEEGIRLVVSFLGGGLVAGVLDWLRANSAEKTARKVDHLSAQIKNLYGPLYFFTSQNEKLFALYSQFHGAYQSEYVHPQWSTDEQTQARLRGETSQTLNLANGYIEIVKANNDKVIEVLRENYAYLDPEDVELFQKFVIDYTRLKKELDVSGRVLTPLGIYNSVGEISFMRPEFMNRVKEKFNEKENTIRQHRAS